MDNEKFAKWLRICGGVFVAGCFIALIVFSFSDCSKKPLSPGEEKRFQELH